MFFKDILRDMILRHMNTIEYIYTTYLQYN